MDFSTEQQEQFIRLAMEQVEESIKVGGNPFGAVLVDAAGTILVATRNTVTPKTDILQHAELNLIREFHEKTGLQKLTDHAVFINASSCSMCASALVQAGVRDFYYGAPFEAHTNPAASYRQLAEFCHEPLAIHDGILVDECVSQIARGREQTQK